MVFTARQTLIATALVAAAMGAVAADGSGKSSLPPAVLATAPVAVGGVADTNGFDGVVQAVRQTAITAQVSGAVVMLAVKVGDPVKAGQVLARIDARAADQTAAAGAAQALAARATQDAAAREYERQKQLFQKNYISQAALDRAEAQYKATQAQGAAQLASAGAARTESGFYVVRAPYGGVVSAVAVVLGDVAMPGRALVTVYDPSALRVAVAVPQGVAARLLPDQGMPVELPGSAAGSVMPVKVQLLPTVDPATHTQELRLDLPAGLSGVAPGMFARVRLPAAGRADGERLYVPAAALVRRAELTGVYLLGADGRPVLRQVRVGRVQGDRIEILSGVSAGERVVLDPQAAARQSARQEP
jgi:RND family efflux transporter MFP subunit